MLGQSLYLPLRFVLNLKLPLKNADKRVGAPLQAARMHTSTKQSRSLHRAGRQNKRSLTTELGHVLLRSLKTFRKMP